MRSWGSNSYGDEGSRATRAVIIMGCAMGISFIMLILAGALFKNWFPMLNLAAVVLIPIAMILSDISGGSSYGGYDETRQAWANMGACFFGTILASMFGLPLILLHAGIVTEQPFGLWIGSTVITFGAALYYWFARGRKLPY